MANDPTTKSSNPRGSAKTLQMLDGVYLVPSPNIFDDPLAWVFVSLRESTERWIHRRGLFPVTVSGMSLLTFIRWSETPAGKDEADAKLKELRENNPRRYTWYHTKCVCSDGEDKAAGKPRPRVKRR